MVDVALIASTVRVNLEISADIGARSESLNKGIIFAVVISYHCRT